MIEELRDVTTPAEANQLSAIYEKRYVAGDEEAIFEYVRRDIFAFRETWVVLAIEMHGINATPYERAWLEQLMGAYTGKVRRARGKSNSVADQTEA